MSGVPRRVRRARSGVQCQQCGVTNDARSNKCSNCRGQLKTICPHPGCKYYIRRTDGACRVHGKPNSSYGQLGSSSNSAIADAATTVNWSVKSTGESKMSNQEVEELWASFVRANCVNGLHHDKRTTLTNMPLDNVVITDEVRTLVSRWIARVQSISTADKNRIGSKYMSSPVAVAAASASSAHSVSITIDSDCTDSYTSSDESIDAEQGEMEPQDAEQGEREPQEYENHANLAPTPVVLVCNKWPTPADTTNPDVVQMRLQSALQVRGGEDDIIFHGNLNDDGANGNKNWSINSVTAQCVDIFPKLDNNNSGYESKRFAHFYNDTYERACVDLLSGVCPQLMFVNSVPTCSNDNLGLTRKACTRVAEVWANLHPRAVNLFELGDPRMFMLWHYYVPICLTVRDIRGRPASGRRRKDWLENRILSRCNFLQSNGYKGLYALLLDMRVIAAYNKTIVDKNTLNQPNDASDSGYSSLNHQPTSELRSILIEAEKGHKTISSLLRKAARSDKVGTGQEFYEQLTSTSPDNNPRICPIEGESDEALFKEMWEAEEWPNTDSKLDEAKRLVVNMLRKLDVNKSSGVDSVPNSVIISLLRLSDNRGAEVLLEGLLCIGSDDVFSDEFKVFRQVLRRGKGCAFEKPKKPGKFRILEQPTWLFAMFCKRQQLLHKDANRKLIEPEQLALAPGGPDAFAHVAWEPFLLRRVQDDACLVTIEADVKQCYPETDQLSALTEINRRAPWMMRVARLAYEDSYISVKQSGVGQCDLLQRKNGLPQGLPISSAIAGILTAKLVRDVRSELEQYYDEEGLPTGENEPLPNLVVCACHDNFIMHVHRDAALFAIQLLKSRAKELRYRLDDWGVYVHGDEDGRSASEQLLASKSGLEPLLQRSSSKGLGCIKRPDVTGRREDILTVMGCPVFDPVSDHQAAEEWFQELSINFSDYTSRIDTLCKQNSNECFGEHDKYCPSNSALQLGFTALKASSCFFHHIAKVVPISFKPAHEFYENIDRQIIQSVTQLLRIQDILAPSQITARSNTANLLADICRYKTLVDSGSYLELMTCIEEYNESYDRRFEEANKIQEERRVSEAEKGFDPLPEPTGLIPINEVRSDLDKLISSFKAIRNVDGQRGSASVTKIPQGKLTQQLWRFTFECDYYSDSYDDKYFPNDWSNEDISSHLRSTIAHGVAINGSAIWGLRRRFRDPFTRKLLLCSLTDLQFLVATRMQLGLCLRGLTSNITHDRQSCIQCNNSRVDDNGFHVLYSCSLQKGFRNKRHADVQRVYESLATQAGLTVSRLAPDVTPFSNRNRNGKKEFGDWTVYDSSGGKAVIFDNTCFCHFSECYRKCARRNCNAKVFFGQSTLGPAATECRRVKYDRKGPGCRDRGQLLLPLVNTFLGAFIATSKGELAEHTKTVASMFSREDIIISGGNTRPAEFALIRRWARRVADDKRGGKGTFDATLSTDGAAGLLVSSTLRKIAFAAIRASANSAIYAAHKNGLQFCV